MSRAANGTYTLPAGNPVVTNSVISSTWANTTLADIATALSDSLSRSGLGVMTAGLQLTDGTIGAPGLTFGTETTAGLRRAAAGDFRFVIGGVDILRIAATSSAVTGTNSAAAGIRWFHGNTNAAADNRYWGARVDQNGDLRFGAYTDANFPTGSETSAWLSVDRTGTTINTITLAATTAAFGSTDVTGSTGSWSGTVTFTATSAAILLSSASPAINYTETDAAADNRRWYISPGGATMFFGVINDAGSVANDYQTVTRSGGTVARVTFPTDNGTTTPFSVGATPAATGALAYFSTAAASTQALVARNLTSTTATLVVQNAATAGDNVFQIFVTEGGSGTTRGSVTFNRGAVLTAFNVTSDGRLKKNIRDSADAGIILDQVKVRAFEWKVEGTTLPHWLVAQELAPLVPYAVTIPSNPQDNWSIDPSKLVPLLVKSVQELRIRVAAMESK